MPNFMDIDSDAFLNFQLGEHYWVGGEEWICYNRVYDQGYTYSFQQAPPTAAKGGYDSVPTFA